MNEFEVDIPVTGLLSEPVRLKKLTLDRLEIENSSLVRKKRRPTSRVYGLIARVRFGKNGTGIDSALRAVPNIVGYSCQIPPSPLRPSTLTSKGRVSLT
jgi:hypothetical protein